jgi:hypothetical protein
MTRLAVRSWYNGFSPQLRSRSWEWLKAERAAGRIPEPLQCQVCGETGGLVDYHTEDYSEPFGSNIWEFSLCFRCHMMLHVRYRRPAAWHRYIEQLEAGAVYVPLMHRGQINQLNADAWIMNPVRLGPSRGRLEWFRSLSMERAAEQPDEAQLFPV